MCLFHSRKGYTYHTLFLWDVLPGLLITEMRNYMRALHTLCALLVYMPCYIYVIQF
jgi:hypothetical protein